MWKGKGRLVDSCVSCRERCWIHVSIVVQKYAGRRYIFMSFLTFCHEATPSGNQQPGTGS
jgi:hypothetical protein